jgi:hypothetical protein
MSAAVSLGWQQVHFLVGSLVCVGVSSRSLVGTSAPLFAKNKGKLLGAIQVKHFQIEFTPRLLIRKSFNLRHDVITRIILWEFVMVGRVQKSGWSTPQRLDKERHRLGGPNESGHGDLNTVKT